MKLWDREPAVILGALGAVIALAVSFGFKLSADQIGAIMAAVSAILAVVVRSQVVPVSKVFPTPPDAG